MSKVEHLFTDIEANSRFQTERLFIYQPVFFSALGVNQSQGSSHQAESSPQNDF
jgi:hypothetical protein